MSRSLTEAEFHAFVERLDTFVRALAPRERLFLMAILARAVQPRPVEIEGYGWHQESAVCVDLAGAIWQSIAASAEAITLNPQPQPLHAATHEP